MSALRQKGQEPGGWLAIKFSIADKLVFSKLKARFGGKIRFFISGGAPLTSEIGEFFHAADILIAEDGDMTPSLKVKRKVVETRYKDVLNRFYAGSLAAI